MAQHQSAPKPQVAAIERAKARITLLERRIAFLRDEWMYARGDATTLEHKLAQTPNDLECTKRLCTTRHWMEQISLQGKQLSRDYVRLVSFVQSKETLSDGPADENFANSSLSASKHLPRDCARASELSTENEHVAAYHAFLQDYYEVLYNEEYDGMDNEQDLLGTTVEWYEVLILNYNDPLDDDFDTIEMGNLLVAVDEYEQELEAYYFDYDIWAEMYCTHYDDEYYGYD